MPERKEWDESAMDAIEIVAREGISRNRPAKRIILLVVLLFATVVSGAVAVFLLTREDVVDLPKLHDWPIAVLLPEMPNRTEAADDGELTVSTYAKGSVGDNATRQFAGFSGAWNVFDVPEKDQHVFHYDFALMKKESYREEVMSKIKTWYDEGIRTFVITMSGGVLAIKPKFIEWAGSLPENDRPVLVATVASAPGITNRAEGVFRHYIRSEEESGVLATYIESLDEVLEVGVFYVNDDYGSKATETLIDRLDASDEINFKPTFDIGLGDEESDDIEQAVSGFVDDMLTANRAVAVIIGYGPMIGNTLLSLQKLNGQGQPRFPGKILVVSTFTEKAWRPDVTGFHDRMRTVGPYSTESVVANDESGVVYQFSYLTLKRALRCRSTRGVEAFWACWTNPPPYAEEELQKKGDEWATVDFTAEGDSIVSLRLLKVEKN